MGCLCQRSNRPTIFPFKQKSALADTDQTRRVSRLFQQILSKVSHNGIVPSIATDEILSSLILSRFFYIWGYPVESAIFAKFFSFLGKNNLFSIYLRQEKTAHLGRFLDFLPLFSYFGTDFFDEICRSIFATKTKCKSPCNRQHCHKSCENREHILRCDSKLRQRHDDGE